MAISTGGGGEERPMSEINTTPLVDVMLVLLIIFLIAVPVAIQTIERLDAIVQRAGGPEAIMEDPDKIPQVHIRGDVNAPWRCIAGTIYNVQAAGYPTIGFISNPVDPNA